MHECDNDTTRKEVEVLYKMLEEFSSPTSFLYHAGTNFVVNGVEIYEELSKAYTNYEAKVYKDFGKDVGVALALVFIGKHDGGELAS